jgi:predicted transposase YbfD/YdcC
MATAHPASIVVHFADLPDPRVVSRCSHNLLDMVVIAICAVLGNADDWVDVATFGAKKAAWFQTFLPLPNGVPSHDTFRRVFARLRPDAFQRCFLSWVEAVRQATGGKLVAIDGKTLRRSFDTAAGKSALHLISAWAGENRLVLGQWAVDDKSNEIPAVPELLGLLDLTGATVTLDALHCQKATAEAVRDAGADYVIALKDNQPTLCRDVTDFFVAALDRDFAGIPHRYLKTVDRDHGRYEVRHYYVVGVPEEIAAKHGWRDLRSLGMVYSERRVGDEEPADETRFYVSSLRPQVRPFAEAVRSHWGIENSLHWVLDVTFREDASRLRKDHGPENLGLLRRLAVSLLQQDTQTKASMKVKRKMAGWDDDYLLSLILGSAKA